MRVKNEAGSNTVFVGKKPSMAYVLAVVTQFSEGQSEIHIRARGNSISKAVDVAEIARNKFVQDAKVDRIQIGTEIIEIDEKGVKDKINVSTIDIILKK
jgi:DNA-binding protein